MHGESGQATVEWAALALLAALLLGAAAAFAGRETDRGLGDLVAKRIARAPEELAAAVPAARAPGLLEPRAPGSPPPPGHASPAAPAPGSRSSAHAPTPGAVEGMRRIKGVGSVARHAWILCIGYQRWRFEREHPLAAIEGLPLGEALGIVNDCVNPHAYLLGD